MVDDDPKRRLRRRLIIGGVVLVLAAGIVAGALALFAGDDTPPKPVPLPEAFGGYVRIHDATAERIENGVAKSLRTRKEGPLLLKSASIGTYARRRSRRARGATATPPAPCSPSRALSAAPARHRTS